MNVPETIPDVVSKRNHFRPAAELAEDALEYLPEQYKHPGFKSWLIRYTETVIRDVAYSFSTAAERGIQQAASLLCDPEYYATQRKRRMNERQRMQEEHAKQEWDRLERMNCPTAEQVGEQILFSERQVEYHRTELARYEASLERLRAIEPKNIRLVPSKKIQ